MRSVNRCDGYKICRAQTDLYAALRQCTYLEAFISEYYIAAISKTRFTYTYLTKPLWNNADRFTKGLCVIRVYMLCQRNIRANLHTKRILSVFQMSKITSLFCILAMRIKQCGTFYVTALILDRLMKHLHLKNFLRLTVT